MNYITLLILSLLSVNLFAQDRNDSLLALLEQAEDTSRIRLLTELCWENRYHNPPEALRYGLEALSLLKETERYSELANINNYLGIIQRNVGDHATALEYFFEARELGREHNLQRELAYSHNNIGDIYNRQKKYELALEYEHKALEIFEKTGDSLGISYTCHQLALVYINQADHTRAMIYDTRAMKIRESMGNRAGVAYSLINIGSNYLQMGKPEKALETLLESSEIFKELEDKFGLSSSMYSIGLYYQTLGDVDAAIRYLKKAIELGRDTESPMIIRNSAQVLSELYAGKEKFEEAYRMYILYKETYDSLYREENLVKITQLALQNEYEQKELIREAELSRQKQLRNYSIISLGLVIVLIMVVLNRYQIKRKANIDLQSKNEEIESQKNELEKLFVSLRIKNDELSQQNDEILSQKDHLVLLNNKLEKQKFELNRTVKDLEQAETQLVQSEKMASLGQLTAGVAHELNNPVNFITASVKPLLRNIEDLLALLGKFDTIIEEKKLSASFVEVAEMKEKLDLDFLVKETQNLLKGINEGASRSKQIVKDLRTFSRMDEDEFSRVDIHEGLDSTLMLLGHKIGEQITVKRNYGKIPHVECLPGKLNQVFMNILTNSILAIEGKGDIQISTSGNDREIIISIKDSGKGMTPEVRDHIFEPFFTTRKVGTGTGLGLSISYSIIQEHNGTIEVISEPGKGSEFIIALPVETNKSNTEG
jgi:signal transduction histidine kinase